MNINAELAKLLNLPKHTINANITLSGGDMPRITALVGVPGLEETIYKSINGQLQLVQDSSIYQADDDHNTFQTALAEILNELQAATTKFPTWPTHALHAIGVVNEEVGELNKEILQLTYEPHKTSQEALRKEAIQAAAMLIRFCMSLDQYDYTTSKQHSQGPA